MQVERWGVFETSLSGPATGNPFTEARVQGTFSCLHETVTVEGFYDGAGVYKVRFMPSFEGVYSYRLSASFPISGDTGTFTVSAATGKNHGPVRVAGKYHFAYEDGSRYVPVGTTCYVWTHQSEALQEETLTTLEKGYFNKIRFCIFPKHYDYNLHEPISYPYEGTPVDSSTITRENFSRYYEIDPSNHWDFARFNPKHFQQIENRLKDLMDLGIEADLIMMHPYDRWGFSRMSAAQDDLYWNYVVARFSAFRNVWWSLANEYDLMPQKTLGDWERYAGILCEKDPYRHLRSVHNCLHLYDVSRPWVTHCSIQAQAVDMTVEHTHLWKDQYHKPVVIDEMFYEGDVEHDWGNISPQEMVRRFWEVTLRGGYATHGETYSDPSMQLWWSHGGTLRGEAGPRLKFLRELLESLPLPGLRYANNRLLRLAVAESVFFAEDSASMKLYYLGLARPRVKTLDLGHEHDHTVEIIDTWGMTIEMVGTFRGKVPIELPGREYLALRITRTG